MEFPFPEQKGELDPDRHPLLMERLENHNDSEHIIDIAVSSHDVHPSGVDPPQLEEIPSISTIAPTYQTLLSSSNRGNSRNSSSIARGDGYAGHGRSTLNSRLWVSVELFVTVGQVIASVVILSLSRHEHPQAPLFEWVVGYTCGCVATIPILYWRYRNRMRATEQDSIRSWHGSSQSNPSSEPASYTASSIAQASEEGNRQTGSSATRISWISPHLSPRLVDRFKMALDCFFAVWFLVGNVWIFGGHSSPSEAPKLYRLCLVFLTFSCIGYAMPFILCATICFCWPCIISVLGFREDLSQTRGATPESINALPIYKFKLTKTGDNQETNSGISDGGVFAAGTEKERVISGEDAVCCICLAKYAENDELRELPCSHFFHVECVDKWLKINASCPLCKYEVGESNGNASPSARNSSPHQSERRPGNGEGVYGTTMI
ncbi:hypothetical protein RHGRI_035258 [Rhododendron griersonianum]|uniref:RING-type domain-containing protein n=1 Tax=Rhododendron griersonianum TaxID=479676 RepID=A0AAV6I487_9ERIC|nr:hypothetical protein RHGRI_035258 [Rhododendron griersonianum]